MIDPDLLSVIVRAAGFVCLFQAAGGALFLALFGSQLATSHLTVRRLVLAAALLGAPLVLAHQALDAARMAGDYAGLMDRDLQRLAWVSSDGAAHLVQALGLLLVATGLIGAQGRNLILAGAVLAVLAFVLTGHTSVHPTRALLAPLLGVHVLVIAFWFGALAPLFLVVGREPYAVAVWVLEKFSALAVWLVPLIPLAGLGLAYVLTPGLAVLRRPYGQLLGVKLLLFAALMGLAALNRLRWVRALMVQGADLGPGVVAGAAGKSLRRSIGAEYLLVAATLSVTAVLTTFYAPDH